MTEVSLTAAERNPALGNEALDYSAPASDVDAEKHAASSRRRTGCGSWKWATGPVEQDYGDWALLVCCLVTGMVDAASFGNWAVFVGMQTGK